MMRPTDESRVYEVTVGKIHYRTEEFRVIEDADDGDYAKFTVAQAVRLSTQVLAERGDTVTVRLRDIVSLRER